MQNFPATRKRIAVIECEHEGRVNNVSTNMRRVSDRKLITPYASSTIRQSMSNKALLPLNDQMKRSPSGCKIVHSESKSSFRKEFAQAMKKMARISVITCRQVQIQKTFTRTN